MRAAVEASEHDRAASVSYVKNTSSLGVNVDNIGCKMTSLNPEELAQKVQVIMDKNRAKIESKLNLMRVNK